MAGSPLTEAEAERIRQLKAEGLTPTEIAKETGRPRATIHNFLERQARAKTVDVALPDPVSESGGPSLPEPVRESYDPFTIDTPGKWLVLSDVHLPHHDKRTVESAVEEARRNNVAGVLLNGDIMDCAALSDHEKFPNEARLNDELAITEQFFQWVRSRLPKSIILWREGNHEARLPRFLMRNAPELAGNAKITLPKLVESEKQGVRWVDGCRPIFMGQLAVLHGHEYRGSGGVSPARWLFQRTFANAMAGHFHRPDEHQARNVRGDVQRTWTLGCACYLHPKWMVLNQWSLGYALVDLASDGSFAVTNRRM